jgi:putative integral membrane protein (TIGR02587 family)
VPTRSRASRGRKRAGAAPGSEDLLRSYLRAIGGGLLVGLPLLFTMEMWWHGFLIPPLKILALLAIGAAVVVGLNAISGFRQDRSLSDVLVDSVEAVGIGIVVAATVLLLLGRLDLGTALGDAVGKIALEAIPIAIGASIATAQFGGRGAMRGGAVSMSGASSGGSNGTGGSPAPGRVGGSDRLVIAAGGALVFALNIAPTEEPVILGIDAAWWLLLIVMAATYVVTLGIVFFAEFRGEHAYPQERGPLASPWAETLVAYVISLGVAFMLLWAFGRTDGNSAAAILGQTVMLGIVASFGAAVGRILLQGGGRPGGGRPGGGGPGAGGRGAGARARAGAA